MSTVAWLRGGLKLNMRALRTRRSPGLMCWALLRLNASLWLFVGVQWQQIINIDVEDDGANPKLSESTPPSQEALETSTEPGHPAVDSVEYLIIAI